MSHLAPPSRVAALADPAIPIAAAGARWSVIVLIPVYNDWQAVAMLLERLDACVEDPTLAVRVMLVDDASTEVMAEKLPPLQLRVIERVDVLPLRRNLGHQRAIAVGLAYVESHEPCDAVVVMDGDGEDAPEDVPRLLGRLREVGGKSVVFAERTRRSESLTFKAFYDLYRFQHRILTGIRVRVGNFSALSRSTLRRLVVVSELWNHYAAAVFVSRIPYDMLPTQRARRLSGRSRMNFVSLVGHGLSAMAVHGERMGVRMLVANLLLLLTLVGVLVGLVGVRLFTDLPMAGWVSTAAGVALVLLSQSLIVSLAVVFLTLHGRVTPGVIPTRDFVYFVDPVQRVFAGHALPRAGAPGRPSVGASADAGVAGGLVPTAPER